MTKREAFIKIVEEIFSKEFKCYNRKWSEDPFLYARKY